MKIVNFRIDKLKSSKDFFNMLFLIIDLIVLIVLVDLVVDEINDDKIDDNEFVNSLNEIKRSNKMF